MSTDNPVTPDPDNTPDPQTPPAPNPESEFDFDGEFDPDRAKRLIAAQKADKEALRQKIEAAERERDELKQKWDAHEAEKLTAEQKQALELEQARKELAAERRKAALVRHQLPESALMFLTAESADDIEAQAAALAELHPHTDDEPPAPDLHVAPQPNLPGGQKIPPSEPPFDPAAIAAAARKRH